MPEETPQLSKEDIQNIINESLDQKLEAYQAASLEAMNTTITGVAGRIKKEMEKVTTDKIEESLSPIQEFLDNQVGKQTTPNTSNSDLDTIGGKPDKMDAISQQLIALQRQGEETEKQNKALKEALEVEKANRQQAELASNEAKAATNFINSVKEKVSDGDAFLTLLKARDGILFDETSQQFVKISQNEWGDEIKTPILGKVDELLNTPKYSYLKAKRPGGGLGSQSSNATPPEASQSKHYKPDGSTDTQELFDVAKKEGTQALVSDLLKTANT